MFSSARQKLHDKCYLVRSDGKSIRQETTVKLLGVLFDHHLTWTDQVNNVLKTTYGALRIIKTFKRFTPYVVRKCLAESLVLSRINYCNVVYGQLPAYLLKRLQNVQNCAAGYVLGKYAKLADNITLNWLPVKENIEYNVVKYVHQALNDDLWPSYLAIEVKKPGRNLRSTSNGHKLQFAEKKVFQDQASVYNELPLKLRQNIDKKSFCREGRKFYKDKALARALSM